jgi:hypothetical protein
MQELDAMNPEMDPQQTAGAPDGKTDREGAMAKADLYKLANYSHKLFQQMHDDDQLEAWVQAKITKAADYIASVYHYLEYEMKFSEYGHHLDNSDTLSEGQKMKLKEVLAEAKMKMADLKKSQAEKIKEDRKETTKTQHGSATSTYDNDGKRKSVVHKDERKYSDEEHGEVASNVKSKSAADKKKEAPAQKQSPKSAKTWGMKNSEKFDNRDKAIDENMEPCSHCGGEGHVPKAPIKVHPSHAGKVAKYSRLKDAVTAIMNDKNKNGIDDRDEGLAEGPGIPATATTTVPGQRATGADLKKANSSAVLGEGTCNHTAKGKKCPVHGLKECSMEESKLPMKKVGGKSVPAFAADSKGKNDLSKKKAVKEGGDKIAAQAMWKKIKETSAYVAEKAEVEKKAKKDYDGDGKVESGKDEHAGSVDKAIKANKAKETVNESSDLTRMKQLMTRLNG